jgi:hypothetical protein
MKDEKKKICVENQGLMTKKAKILKVEMSLKLVRDSRWKDTYTSELRFMKNPL